MSIFKGMQEKIIDLFCNTKLKIPEILHIVDIDDAISFEEFYKFLYEYRTDEGQRLRKNQIDFESQMDNRIYELRKQKKTFEEISQILLDEGYRITADCVKYRCERLFRLKNEKNVSVDFQRSDAVKISGKEIFERVLNGEKQVDILKEYNEQGLNISYSTVNIRYRKYCESIGYNPKEAKKQNKEKEKNKLVRKLDGYEDLIYKLRAKEYPYAAIQDVLNKQGVNVSKETIRLNCKKLFKQKGKKEPKYARFDYQKNDNEELYNTIYNLRKQGYSYDKISSLLKESGIDLSNRKVYTLCKKIFKKRKKVEPKTKSRTAITVSNQRVYEMRKNGVSCTDMTDILNSEGIQVSYAYLVNLCRQIFREKGEKMPPIKKHRRGNEYKFTQVKDKKLLIDAMLKVAEKKKATQEQLKAFAKEISKYYREDINLDFATSKEEGKNKEEIEIA